MSRYHSMMLQHNRLIFQNIINELHLNGIQQNNSTVASRPSPELAQESV